MNNHLAPYFEYSAYAYDDDKMEGDLKFSEFGASCYFKEKGKGLYLGVGVSSLKVKASNNDVSLDFGKTGSGSTEIALNTTNLKLGLRQGDVSTLDWKSATESEICHKMSSLQQQTIPIHPIQSL